VRITEKTEIYCHTKRRVFRVIEGVTYNYQRASNGYYTLNHIDHKIVIYIFCIL